jgi:hypothetical protein
MRILDILAGRTRPAQANLDALFGLSTAFITLEASQSLVPSGEAGVCYKPAAGQPFARTTDEMESLLGLAGGPIKVREETDQYGFHWVVIGAGPGAGSGTGTGGGGAGSGTSAGAGPNLDPVLDSDTGLASDSGDPEALVNQVHVVNMTLEEDGFGPQLLCSVFGFRPSAAGASAHATAYIVYLYKRGTFYPFIPLHGKEQRDVSSELLLADVLAEDLKIEKDKERWMALWELPIH